MASTNLICLCIMCIIQIAYGAMNVISKLAIETGLNPLVQVAYRQIFGTVVLGPFAYFAERHSRPPMSRGVLLTIFFSSLFGSAISQVFYFYGLKYTTVTTACALTNLLPALTFLLAVPFRVENLNLHTRAGQAKVLGTLMSVGGAIFLSLYHGLDLLPRSSFNSAILQNTRAPVVNKTSIMGPLLVIGGEFCCAAWLIIQAKVGAAYPAPYTTAAISCFMSSLECTLVALVVVHPSSTAWHLTPPIRAVSTAYAGVGCSAFAFVGMSWCIQQKGPLYVSVFSPLLLIFVGLLSWAILDEVLYFGIVIGSILIVIGLYIVLWAKKSEVNT